MRAPRLAAAIGGVLLLAACGGADERSGTPTTPAPGAASATPSPDTQAFRPSERDHDPSSKIPGVQTHAYPLGLHVEPAQRVAYDQSPPYGGPHDYVWAACNGVVYKSAVRNENMVHTLEHGAVWIAYNPDRLNAAQVQRLAGRVTGQQYLSLSPYPGLDRPVSLQSWGHRLKVDSVEDPRIDEFIAALRLNRYTTPELGATCDQDPGYFDPDNPPPFDPSPPGPDAVPVTGSTAPTSTG